MGGVCSEVIGDTYSNGVEPPSISSLPPQTGALIRIRKQPPGDPVCDPAPKGRMTAHAGRPLTHKKWPTVPPLESKGRVAHPALPTTKHGGERYTIDEPHRSKEHKDAPPAEVSTRRVYVFRVVYRGPSDPPQWPPEGQTGECSHIRTAKQQFVGIKISCKQFVRYANTPYVAIGSGLWEKRNTTQKRKKGIYYLTIK